MPDVLTVGFCAEDVKLGPDQLYVTPEVDELPVSVTEVLVHVSFPPLPVAPGKVTFCETIAVSVDTQPFTGLVTVKV